MLIGSSLYFCKIKLWCSSQRDRKSFISTPENNQYAYVMSKCKEMNFGFYVTNPCFEF